MTEIPLTDTLRLTPWQETDTSIHPDCLPTISDTETYRHLVRTGRFGAHLGRMPFKSSTLRSPFCPGNEEERFEYLTYPLMVPQGEWVQTLPLGILTLQKYGHTESFIHISTAIAVLYHPEWEVGLTYIPDELEILMRTSYNVFLPSGVHIVSKPAVGQTAIKRDSESTARRHFLFADEQLPDNVGIAFHARQGGFPYHEELTIVEHMKTIAKNTAT